jgi:adenylate cyclase
MTVYILSNFYPMRPFRLIFCLLLFPFLLQSQNAENLENELAKARDGKVIFRKSMELADIYLKNRQYGQAEFKAQKALEVATSDAEHAFAYAVYARAQARQGKPAAAKAFRQAVRFFKNSDPNRARELAKEWRELAKNTQQSGDVTDADKILADLEAQNTPLSKNDDSDKKQGGFFKNAFGGKRRELEKQVEDLNNKVAVAKKQVTENQSVIAKLNSKNATLETSVEAQRAAINQMTAEQARAELLLSQQGRLLDSMRYQQTVDSIQLLQQETLLVAANAELAQQRAERNLFLTLGVLIAVLAIGFFLRSRALRQHNRILEEKNRLIREEKQRSEDLLLNILPQTIAEELKKNGAAEARQHEAVSVLFTDFVNFTKIAERMSAQQLVRDLDYCFKNFDRISQQNGLEKIKTIGDAYMCAAGLPTPQYDHAQRIIRAALAMQDFLNDWKAERIARDEPYFEARIGIHTGNLVAGVVGSKKFAYDIWGDTVNLAARIESAGEAGRVNISEETYRLVNSEFNCTPRGKILTKSKGELNMFFVENEA